MYSFASVGVLSFEALVPVDSSKSSNGVKAASSLRLMTQTGRSRATCSVTMTESTTWAPWLSMRTS